MPSLLAPPNRDVSNLTANNGAKKLRCVGAENVDASGKATKAFTLIELLVVVAIISLLMGILIPSLSKAREVSRRSVCLNNLRQLAIASFSYDQTNGTLPGPVIPCALDPQVVNADPSLIDYTLRGDLRWYPKRNLATDNVLGEYVKSRGTWFCPSGKDLRENAVPVSGSSPFKGRKLQYGYLCNNQSTTSPSFYFGYWFTDRTAVDETPKKLVQVTNNTDKPVSPSENWMFCDIDGPLLNTSVASYFSIATKTTLPFDTYPWQPVHQGGQVRGRCWVFFDGHAEYRTTNNNPWDPMGN